MDKLISVVTASYNYASYIEETIESVLNQTYQNWELIVVDDGSKDNSIELISEYCKKDKRIKLFTHENNQNKGLPETLKLGVEKSNGEYIAFLESDDTFLPNNLEEKMHIIEKYPEVALIFSDLALFGDENAIKSRKRYTDEITQRLSNYKFPNRLSFADMLYSNLVPTFSVVMVRKDLIEKCDFNPSLRPWLDYHLWLQILDKPFYFIDKKLSNWRIHADSYIQNKISQKDVYKFRKEKIKNKYQNDIILYLFLFILYIAIVLKIYLKINLFSCFANK